jgi:hypothetical protein
MVLPVRSVICNLSSSFQPFTSPLPAKSYDTKTMTHCCQGPLKCLELKEKEEAQEAGSYDRGTWSHYCAFVYPPSSLHDKLVDSCGWRVVLHCVQIHLRGRAVGSTGLAVTWHAMDQVLSRAFL